VNQLKIGINTRIWASYPFEEMLRRISSIGYKYIEIFGCRPHAFPLDLTDQSIAIKKEAIEKQKLYIACFTPEQFFPVPHINPASSDEKIRKDSILYLKRGIDCAGKFGATIFSMGAGKIGYKQSKKDGFVRAAQSIGECVDYAKEKNIKLALEPLPRLESNIVVTLDDYLDMENEVKSNNLGCLLDVGHQNIIGENLVDWVEILGNKLFHIQISDNDGRSDQGLIPGKGSIQFKPFFAALINNNYKGVISVELSFSYMLAPDIAAFESLHYIRKILSEL
jgi:protein FrlC